MNLLDEDNNKQTLLGLDGGDSSTHTPAPQQTEIQFTNDPFEFSNQAELKLVTEGGDGDGDKGPEEDGGKQEQQEQKPKVTFNPIAALKQYFDVDTSDILDRTKQVIIKGYAGGFCDDIAGKADLYGPFWIATTLVVVSSICGSFAQYLSGKRKNDVDKVTASVFFFYGYVTLLPIAIWGILIYYRSPIPLTSLVCLYGYAMSIFIPAAILCTSPTIALFLGTRWTVIFVAAAISGLGIVMNLKKNFTEALQQKAYIFLASLGVVHVALAIALKMYFFNY